MSDANAPNPDPTPPPEPAAAGPGPQTGAAYGGLGKRFLARLIDALLIGIPLGIILGVIPGISFAGWVGGVVSSIVGFAYFLLMETSQGATFGKQWLGMTVAGQTDTSPISMDASARRNWWMLLGVVQGIPFIGWLAGLASLVIVIVIAVTISSDPRNQGWHDKLGGTFVLERSAA